MFCKSLGRFKFTRSRRCVEISDLTTVYVDMKTSIYESFYVYCLTIVINNETTGRSFLSIALNGLPRVEPRFSVD